MTFVLRSALVFVGRHAGLAGVFALARAAGTALAGGYRATRHRDVARGVVDNADRGTTATATADPTIAAGATQATGTTRATGRSGTTMLLDELYLAAGIHGDPDRLVAWSEHGPARRPPVWRRPSPVRRRRRKA